jgi:UMP-CMP kinase
MPSNSAPVLPSPDRSSPLYPQSEATVVFVLGGPGAGKGTQCARLVRDYGFVHLSAGDLLRAEQRRPGSQFGNMIREYIRDGQIVPMEVTVQLLENAMGEAIDVHGKHNFLIDGFPRKMDQAEKFEQAVCKSRFTLFFDVGEEELQRRLLERGKTSGRADDNEESIRKRFKTFVETSMPVVEAFEKEGRVVRIDGARPPDVVYKDVQAKMKEWGIELVEKVDEGDEGKAKDGKEGKKWQA